MTCRECGAPLTRSGVCPMHDDALDLGAEELDPLSFNPEVSNHDDEAEE